jgi:hypothetical protein
MGDIKINACSSNNSSFTILANVNSTLSLNRNDFHLKFQFIRAIVWVDEMKLHMTCKQFCMCSEPTKQILSIFVTA